MTVGVYWMAGVRSVEEEEGDDEGIVLGGRGAGNESHLEEVPGENEESEEEILKEKWHGMSLKERFDIIFERACGGVCRVIVLTYVTSASSALEPWVCRFWNANYSAMAESPSVLCFCSQLGSHPLYFFSLVAPQIECRTRQHLILIALSLCSLVFTVFTVPLFFPLILLRSVFRAPLSPTCVDLFFFSSKGGGSEGC